MLLNQEEKTGSLESLTKVCVKISVEKNGWIKTNAIQLLLQSKTIYLFYYICILSQLWLRTKPNLSLMYVWLNNVQNNNVSFRMRWMHVCLCYL